MQKQTFLRFKYFTIFACHIPHIIVLLARNCANLGNVYKLAENELTFLKLSLVTGIALLIKLSVNTSMFFFTCQNSENILKFFMVLYVADILGGFAICLDTILRKELWKEQEELSNVFIAEIVYLVLVLLMVIIEFVCLFVYKKCLQIGHFRRRRVTDALRLYLKEPLKLSIN